MTDSNGVYRPISYRETREPRLNRKAIQAACKFLKSFKILLTQFRMTLFGAAHDGGPKCLPSLKSVTHILQ